MKTRYYFGYGSLVNNLTLPADTQWQKAKLDGWRRSWRHPVEGTPNWAAMDAKTDSGSCIDGILVKGNKAIDAYLANRESGYTPISINPEKIHPSEHICEDAEIYIWASKLANTTKKPLLLMRSYVNVVILGYLNNFGENTIQDFVNTTDNWHLPMVDDSDNPVYPRAVSLKQEELRLINSVLQTI